MLSKNTILSSKWKVGKHLGGGAFGQIYTVKSQGFEVPYKTVIKIAKLPPNKKKLNEEENLMKITANSIYHERTMLTGHLSQFPYKPQIPPNFYGEDQGVRYIVMEKMDFNLSEYSNLNFPINNEDLKSIGKQLLKALKWLHDHRIMYVDLKPENVMFSGDSLKIVDYGSTILSSSTGTKQLGTPIYASLRCTEALVSGDSIVYTKQDDIEAYIYLLISLKVKLPWSNKKSPESLFRKKSETNIKELCGNELKKIYKMYKKIKSTDEDIDYDYLKKQINSI